MFYRDVPQISEKLAKMTFKMILVLVFWLLTLVRSFDFNHHQGPTPFETFLLPLNYIIRSESSLKHLNCHSGIVLTASHNPPEYNGYKVYWQDGGQIVPPQDGEIIAEIEAIKYSDIDNFYFL